MSDGINRERMGIVLKEVEGFRRLDRSRRSGNRDFYRKMRMYPLRFFVSGQPRATKRAGSTAASPFSLRHVDRVRESA